MKFKTTQYRESDNGHEIGETWELDVDGTPGSPGSWNEPPSGPEVWVNKAVLVEALDLETDSELETGLELDEQGFKDRFGMGYDGFMELCNEILESFADDEEAMYEDACEAAYDAWKENGGFGRPRCPRRRPSRW